jgi:serine/threonine protein kinase
MKPEHWARVDEVFHAALSRDPDRRAEFIVEACRGDQMLLKEVESLIKSHEQADSFIESPASDLAADMLASGQHKVEGTLIGPYRILNLLGVGGMGEVYLAEDIRLGRRVALKVLPPHFTDNPERLQRFEQEARAASMLNHPNIVTVHEIGQLGGAHFIVTEFIEGQTLRQQMAAASMKLREALDVAMQVTAALGAAHKAGIAHRDIKPENIMLRPDGLVKVLDFGLAKLMPAQTLNPDDEASTLERVKTEAGLVMGTVTYMSPEQARGLAVDARTDIFSLGVVLYEMVAGRAPFDGTTVSDVIAAILKEEPAPLRQYSRRVPAELEWVMKKALTKDREERYQTIRELQIDLKRLAQELQSRARQEDATARPTDKVVDDSASQIAGLGSDADLTRAASDAGRLVIESERRKRVLIPNSMKVAAALAVIAGLSAVSFFAGLKQSQLPSQPIYQPLTFRRGTITTARFAPDGKTVVYSAAFGGKPLELFTCYLGSPESGSLKLQGGLQSISPTGEVAILLDCVLDWGECRDGTLARVPMVGGTPREIMENVYEADWSPDGKDLAIVRVVEGEYQLEYPVGKVLYKKPTGWIRKIRVSPKGDMIAFFDHTVIGSNGGSVMVVDLNGQLRTLADGWRALRSLAWYPTGHEVWFSGNRGKEPEELWAVTPSGHLRSIQTFSGGTGWGAPQWVYDIFGDGRVLMARGAGGGGAHMIGITADSEKERELSQYSWSTSADISADGKTLLFYEWNTARDESPYVYLRKLDGSNDPVRLGKGKALALSPDAKWAIALEEGPPPQLTLLPTGAGESRALPRGEMVEYHYASWFPDGRQILFTGLPCQGCGLRSYVQDVSTGQIQPITEGGVIALMVSADGKRLLSWAPDGGPYGRYFLLPLDRTRPIPIPGIGLGEVPIQWSSDGRAIFVRGPDDVDLEIYRVELSDGRRKFWKKLQPDPVGLIGVEVNPGGIRVTPDGKSYVYTYWTILQNLFLVEGLK